MTSIPLKFRYPQCNTMLHELEKYGRTISRQPCATRELSIKLKPLKELKLIYFSQTYVKGKKTTIITLKPGKTLKISNNRISIKNPSQNP